MCDCDVFRREIGRESWKRVVANFSKDGLVCRNTTGLEWGGGGRGGDAIRVTGDWY